MTDLIAAGAIPERVVHNDTKLNNVLLDDATAEGVCVIDLDTTMPGSVLYDFGDMIRTAAPTSREDDPDPAGIRVRLDRFEALVKGYLSSATFLTECELAHLAFSGKLITLEVGAQSGPLPQSVRLRQGAGARDGGDGGRRGAARSSNHIMKNMFFLWVGYS